MKLYLLWAAVFVATAAVAKGPAKEKEKKDKKAETYVFQDVKTVPVTSVKDQSRSGTCWSFSGMGEVESDLLVRGKGEHDLAEMWIVRNAYFEKAVRYVRMHGSANLGGGGTLNDVVYIIDRYGIVPRRFIPACVTEPTGMCTASWMRSSRRMSTPWWKIRTSRSRPLGRTG